MNLRILYQDDYIIAVDKPAGFYVHPPEDGLHRISRNVNCLHLLRKQTGLYLYPVHRLDRATSGVLLYALQTETAAQVAAQFKERLVQKRYFAVTRGWVPDVGHIDHPVDAKESRTSYIRVARAELPNAVGRYATARYSLVRAEPHTGRLHQIRRHFAHLSHPLVGDTVHGDGAHNRYFRDELKIPGLMLKSYSLSLTHPVRKEPLRITARWTDVWHQAFDIFGLCPFEEK